MKWNKKEKKAPANFIIAFAGVRIIIDIFFDKNESDIDIVGSRVETDIPESRILADFQQHSLATRSSQQVKQQPNV